MMLGMFQSGCQGHALKKFKNVEYLDRQPQEVR